MDNLAAFADAPATDGRALADHETFATLYAGDAPACTLTRPYLGRGLYKLSATDGRPVAAFAGNPLMKSVQAAARAYVRAGAGLDSMTAAELAAERRDALAREAVNRDMAEAAGYVTFEASATCRAIRAARRAELAAERLAFVEMTAAYDRESTCPGCGASIMDTCRDCARRSAELANACARASTPALEAAARDLVRREDFARLRVVASALATRQHIGLAPLPRNATADERDAAEGRREELARTFALHIPAARELIRIPAAVVVATVAASPAFASPELATVAELAEHARAMAGGVFAFLAGVSAFAWGMVAWANA